jgi:hypothetical protein
MDDFFKPKIMYPNMTKYLPFILDNKGFFINDKGFIITGENIEYLTAVFNSSLFKFCFKENFPELLGGTRELRKVFLDKIPIKKITAEMNKIFSEKVNQIQEMKQENKDTKILEIEIDNLIFDLYGLTKKERKTIGFIEII